MDANAGEERKLVEVGGPFHFSILVPMVTGQDLTQSRQGAKKSNEIERGSSLEDVRRADCETASGWERALVDSRLPHLGQPVPLRGGCGVVALFCAGRRTFGRGGPTSKWVHIRVTSVGFEAQIGWVAEWSKAAVLKSIRTIRRTLAEYAANSLFCGLFASLLSKAYTV
jgi:hypothetical protein